MPHYKDGTPAEIGDHVRGVPYNTKGAEVVGTLVQITEGCDSCNCIVAFIAPEVLPDLDSKTMYQLAPHLSKAMLIRRKGGRIERNSGDQTQEILLLNPGYDYGALKDFEKL